MMRSMRTALIPIVLVLACAVTPAAWADEEPTSIALESPDYSEEALLRILSTEPVEVEVHEDRIELRWADWILRFMPLVLPLTLNDGSYGSAQIHEPVSAFALLGLDFPMAGPAADELPPEQLTFRERRFRSRMISQVNRANKLDNQ